MEQLSGRFVLLGSSNGVPFALLDFIYLAEDGRHNILIAGKIVYSMALFYRSMYFF